MSKTASIVVLVLIVALIVGFAYLGISGVPLGRYDFLPLSQSISQGLDLKGGVYAVYKSPGASQDDLQRAIIVMRNRLDNNGYTEATITTQAGDEIRVEIPGVSDPNAVFDLIGTPAVLQFKDPNGKIIMTGDKITKASEGLNNGEVVVDFTLNAEGSKEFADATTKLVGQPISIYLDGNEISSPNVNTPITGGSGYIEGSFTVEEAQKLASELQSGAIPIKLNQTEAQSISATLGVDALKTSIEAGLIGMIVVILFMLVNYRLPGALAGLALLIYVLIVLYTLAIAGIQLTLPGIAGIILGIGVAVDANVIIFERIKEEMMTGKTLRSAVDGGFKKALVTILDANLTALMAAIVLVFMGTGPIKGFAYCMILGIVASMFTAVVITKFLMNIMIKLNITTPWLYSGKWHKQAEAVK
jgi:protein-export SecD/SecF family membrane protein